MIAITHITLDKEGRTRYGTIHINGVNTKGSITYYADRSYDITPAWLEQRAINLAGGKGAFRRALNEAMTQEHVS